MYFFIGLGNNLGPKNTKQSQKHTRFNFRSSQVTMILTMVELLRNYLAAAPQHSIIYLILQLINE